MATNTVGQDSQTNELFVHTHPAFTEILKDMALNKGERLLLTCGATGIPPPKITWAFNNNSIPGEKKSINFSSNVASLQNSYVQESLLVINLCISSKKDYVNSVNFTFNPAIILLHDWIS